MIKPWRAIRQVYQLHTRISLQNNIKIALGHEWLCCMAFVDRPPKGDTSAHSVFENGRVRVCVHPRFMPMIMPTHSSYTPKHIHMAHTHTHSFQTEGRQIEKLPWWFSRVSSGMYMFLLSLTIYVVQLYPKVNEENVVKKEGVGKKQPKRKKWKKKGARKNEKRKA